MLTLDAVQAGLVASSDKTVRWAFYIYDTDGTGYSYATLSLGSVEWPAEAPVWAGTTEWDSGDNLSSIVLTDFAGLDFQGNKSESGIISPSEVTFTIVNPDNAIDFAKFKGGVVFIQLYLYNAVYGEKKIGSWKFRIKTADPSYQTIKILAEDWLQQFLRGHYPNTRYPQDIFPSGMAYAEDGVCLPVPFGTAYVPLRTVFIDNSVTVSGTTIAAVAISAGQRAKFTDSANGLAVINKGATITVAGFTNSTNNGIFTVLAVTAGYIEVAEALVDEAASAAVTISHGYDYIMLGDADYTFSITEVSSNDLKFTSSEYSFNQYTLPDAQSENWRVFQAIIAKTDPNGAYDCPGFLRDSNNQMIDMLVKFTRADTASITNPSDVIKFVLLDMGVPSGYIDDASFLAAHNTFDSYTVPLTFNGAFWYKEEREKILSGLLNQCHSYLLIGEKIELHVMSKTSVQTITSADILRTGEDSPGSFSYKNIVSEDYSDSGYVAWQKEGEPQNRFLKILVPADAVANIISQDVLPVPFVQDSRDVQRIGKLYAQRKYMKDAEISLTCKGTCLAIQPDDIITISGGNYGAAVAYSVLVSGVTINKDGSAKLDCTKYSVSFDDWGDLSPAEVTIPSDITPYIWQPPIAGPTTDQDIGTSAFDLWGKEWLKVGTTKNSAQFTDLQQALNAVNQAGGGALYILNGDYQMTAPLYVPDVNLTIIGQSQGGVVLKNSPDEELWVLHNLKKTYQLSNFTVDSQNTTDVYHNLIYIYGDTVDDNLSNIFIDHIGMTLVSQTVAGIGVGDYGIANLIGNSNITIDACTITGGASGVICYGKSAVLKNSILSDQTFYGVIATVENGEQSKMLDNIFLSQLREGIYVYVTGTQEFGPQIIGNRLAMADNADYDGHTVTGIRIRRGDNFIISQNEITKLNSLFGGGIIGIIVGDGGNIVTGGQVISNNIKAILNLGESYPLKGGIVANMAQDCQITNNVIDINNLSGVTAPVLGTYFNGIRIPAIGGGTESARNNVSGNTINLGNNYADDVGIYIGTGCNNNQGSDNITYNCGTSIVDNGTNNTVTAKDV